MYHERTKESISRTRRRIIGATIVLLLLAVACVMGYQAVDANLKETGAASVRSAILDAAMEAAAVEGAYPSNIQYLQDHYGLVVDTDDYVITYETFGANVVPTVVAVPR